MSIFRSDNPTLSEKIFNRSLNAEQEFAGTMTVRGTINKFGFLLLMILAGATYTWYLYEQAIDRAAVMPYMFGGMIGGLIVALVISFKPKWSPFLAPAYAILEGLFLGAISVVINDMFKEKYPGIVMQAVALTFCVAIAMFLLYNFRVIRPTQKFKSILITATFGIALFYLVMLVMSMFGAYPSFMQWNNGSWLGIAISLFVIAIAALNLIMDFEMIEVGAESGAPKYMEWYGAFGLMVTIVWLYVEMLKLLSRLASNRN